MPNSLGRDGFSSTATLLSEPDFLTLGSLGGPKVLIRCECPGTFLGRRLGPWPHLQGAFGLQSSPSDASAHHGDPLLVPQALSALLTESLFYALNEERKTCPVRAQGESQGSAVALRGCGAVGTQAMVGKSLHLPEP